MSTSTREKMTQKNRQGNDLTWRLRVPLRNLTQHNLWPISPPNSSVLFLFPSDSISRVESERRGAFTFTSYFEFKSSSSSVRETGETGNKQLLADSAARRPREERRLHFKVISQYPNERYSHNARSTGSPRLTTEPSG